MNDLRPAADQRATWRPAGGNLTFWCDSQFPLEEHVAPGHLLAVLQPVVFRVSGCPTCPGVRGVRVCPDCPGVRCGDWTLWTHT